jgi:hypothetical protein
MPFRIMSVEEQVKSHTEQVEPGVPVRYGEGSRIAITPSRSTCMNDGRECFA